MLAKNRAKFQVYRTVMSQWKRGYISFANAKKRLLRIGFKEEATSIALIKAATKQP